MGPRRTGHVQRHAALVARLHRLCRCRSNAPAAATIPYRSRARLRAGRLVVREGAGWAVKDGLRAGIEAISIAKARIGVRRVDRVYAWGNSLGGLITQTLAEQRDPTCPGCRALWRVLAGTNRNLDSPDEAVAVKKFSTPLAQAARRLLLGC